MGDKGVIRSGSMSMNDVPDDDQDSTPVSDTKATESKPEPKSAAPDKNYTELKKVFDRQGNELGELRRQNQELYNAMKGIQESQTQKAQPANSGVNDDLSNVLNEYGSLDFLGDEDAPKRGAELMKQAIGLTARMVKEDTLKEADSTVRNLLQEKDFANVQNKFLDENPDFTELQRQGVFQALKSKNPLHDDFSAYHALKANNAMQQISELEQALAEAKQIANLTGGDTGTAKVFTKPGADVRAQRQTKPKSPGELKQSAMEAIKRARGG